MSKSVTPVSEEMRIFSFIKDPTGKPRPEPIPFAAQLIAVFGLKFGAYLEMQQKHKQGREAINTMRRILPEIQNGLARGYTVYTEFPHTAKFIDKNCPVGIDKGSYFSQLTEYSYDILTFPQRILSYPNPQYAILRDIESVREKALSCMCSRLTIRSNEPVEEKKASSDWVDDSPLPDPASRPLTDDDEFRMTTLYFKAGALYWGDRELSFSDILDLWKNQSSQTEQARNSFVKCLTTHGHVIEQFEPPIGLVKYQQNCSFKDFLIRCSIDSIQHNLEIEFTPSVISFLSNSFFSEQVRSDVCYFTKNRAQFYQANFEQLNRPSAHILISLQMALFMTRAYLLGRDDKLLEMIVFRKESKIRAPGFEDRSWDQIGQEDPDLSRVLIELEPSLIGTASQDPYCWELLILLWNDKTSDVYTLTFSELIKIPNFVLNVSSMYRFCRENAEDFPLQMREMFVESYRNTINQLTERGIHIPNPAALFFDPPLKIEPNLAVAIGDAPKRALRFAEAMARFNFPANERYIVMVRQYVLHPNRILFDLLQTGQQVGINPTDEDLLYEVFSQSLPPLSDREVQQSEYQEARDLLIGVLRKYRFKNIETFFLYLEFIRLAVKKETARIGAMSEVVCRLEAFCPSLKNDIIYFFFHYHPDILPEKINFFNKLRREWANSEQELSRCVINPEVFTRIISKITDFITPLASVCEDLSVSAPFMTSFQESMVWSFFPPLQPLTDYFRVSNVTEDGVAWNGAHLESHLGQLKFVLGDGSLGIYLHWQIAHNFPTLYLTYFDMQKNRSFGGFFPLRVPVDQLKRKETRQPFYNLVYMMGQLLLKEEANHFNPSLDPEQPDTWVDSYTGARDALETFHEDIQRGHLTNEHVNAVLDFLKRVKIAYRTNFLCSEAELPPVEFPSFERPRVASIGRIFSSSARGALLPPSLYDIDPYPEYYSPDADPQFVEGCAPLFSQPNGKRELLNLSLIILNDGEKISLPIYYQVQNVDQICRYEASQKWNEVAPKRNMTGGSYVNLGVDLGGKFVNAYLRYPEEVFKSELFPRYFDFHNLVLKSMVYQQIYGARGASSSGL